MKIRFDHIMMHTVNMEESIKFFQSVLEMELENTDDYETFRLAYLKDKSTNVKFELREVFGQDKQPNGNVLGHFAFYVDDVYQVIYNLFLFSGNSQPPKPIPTGPTLICDHEGTKYKFEHHVSKKHGKEYLIFTFWSPDGIELSALQKIVG